MNQVDHQVVIETVALGKRYKDFWGRDKVRAVDDLNLQIHRGEVFGLLGPNGSGKTTTIKMLLGLLYPTAGRARVFGKDPANVEVKSRIGYLPEETRLYQFLDSWETLDFYGRIFNLGADERAKRAEALVEMVGLGPAASRPVGQYSKGMARRIGLAQSLINDPDLLILDEPTSGLDPIGTRQIKDLLIELKKRGKTILLSSHLLADVEDVCDRVAIMYGGKLLCCGRIEDLLAQQDVTQIQTENLDADQIQKLNHYLSDQLGSKVLSIGAPRDRLERFFLRMVQEAQRQMQTSGALAGGKVSEFLRSEGEGPSAGELLQRLTSDDAIKPASEPVQAAPLPSKVEHDVLDNLMTGRESPPSAVPAKDVKTREPAKPAEVDRSLLDGLTGKPDPNRDTRRKGD